MPKRIDILKLSDLKKCLNGMGVPYSMDNIRKLELQGLIECSRLPAGHRYYTQEQFNEAVRRVCYYYMGASIEEIKNNGEVLRARGKKILKIAKSLVK